MCGRELIFFFISHPLPASFGIEKQTLCFLNGRLTLVGSRKKRLFIPGDAHIAIPHVHKFHFTTRKRFQGEFADEQHGGFLGAAKVMETFSTYRY